MTILRPGGDGYVFDHAGRQWRVRPGYPGGWELYDPDGAAIGWYDTAQECVESVVGGITPTCDACGHPARDGDPLVTVQGVTDPIGIHRSHTRDLESGFYGAQEIRR